MAGEGKDDNQQLVQTQSNGVTSGVNTSNRGMKHAGNGLYKYDATLLNRNLTDEEKRHNSFVNKQLASEKENKRLQKALKTTSSKRIKSLVSGKMDSGSTQLQGIKDYATFCLNQEGGDIYLRLNVSKIINLRTLKAEDASSGDVYLCYLDDMELIKE